jgi:hypothetical protein
VEAGCLVGLDELQMDAHCSDRAVARRTGKGMRGRNFWLWGAPSLGELIWMR